MKNEEVIKAFLYSDLTARTKNVFIESDVLYSYGYHFPIALKLSDMKGNTYVLINTDKYSVSTSRHQFYLKVELATSGFNVVKTNTNELKQIVSSNIRTFEDLVLSNLISNTPNTLK